MDLSSSGVPKVEVNLKHIRRLNEAEGICLVDLVSSPGGLWRGTRAAPRSSSRANIIPSGRLRRAQPLLLVTPNATSYLYARRSTLNSLALPNRQCSVPYQYWILSELFSKWNKCTLNFWFSTQSFFEFFNTHYSMDFSLQSLFLFSQFFSYFSYYT